MVINICRVVDPEIIVFGGGLSKAGKPLLDVIRKHVNQRTWKLPTDVKLALALAAENGVIGAALAANSELPACILQNAANYSSSVVQTTTATNNIKNQTNKKQQIKRMPSWVGAFFALSSVTLFTLEIVQCTISNRSRTINARYIKAESRGSSLVSWLTRGLLAGQVYVGAYALYLCLREGPQVEEHEA